MLELLDLLLLARRLLLVGLCQLITKALLDLHDFSDSLQQVVQFVIESVLCIQVLDAISLFLNLFLQLVNSLG